jgi:hypothetical protein
MCTIPMVSSRSPSTIGKREKPDPIALATRDDERRHVLTADNETAPGREAGGCFVMR